MQWHLAQFNVARLHQPLDHPDTAAFVERLGPINEVAESSPGFVWRLQDDEGQSSSYVVVYDDPLMIINFSLWETVEFLSRFVYKSAHTTFLRRRRSGSASRTMRTSCAGGYQPERSPQSMRRRSGWSSCDVRARETTCSPCATPVPLRRRRRRRRRRPDRQQALLDVAA